MMFFHSHLLKSKLFGIFNARRTFGFCLWLFKSFESPPKISENDFRSPCLTAFKTKNVLSKFKQDRWVVQV